MGIVYFGIRLELCLGNGSEGSTQTPSKEGRVDLSSQLGALTKCFHLYQNKQPFFQIEIGLESSQKYFSQTL